MRVPYDEGVATRIGPEPCAGVREGVGEASVGECIGQPLNRESPFIPGADTVELVELRDSRARGAVSGQVRPVQVVRAPLSLSRRSSPTVMRASSIALASSIPRCAFQGTGERRGGLSTAS